MQASEERAPLLHLLNAPSKQAVDDFLCSCARERESAASPGSSRFGEIASSFAITTKDARQLQQAGAELVGDALYQAPSTLEEAATLFHDDFHSDLRTLLTRILAHRVDEWRAHSLDAGGVSTMPKLQRTAWHVYRKALPSTGSVAPPALLLDLTLGEQQHSQHIKVEMSKEQLEAMLASLSKVKDQLEHV